VSIYNLLLSRLAGVRKSSPRAGCIRAHRALCPVHQNDGRIKGRSPSLSIAETTDGAVLIYCYAGCDPSDVVAAVGLDIADLFPPTKRSAHGNGGISTWVAATALADAVAWAAARVTAGDVEAYTELVAAIEKLKSAVRKEFLGRGQRPSNAGRVVTYSG